MYDIHTGDKSWEDHLSEHLLLPLNRRQVVKTHPRLDSDKIFPVLVVEPEPKQFVQIKECGLTDGDQVNTVLYMIRHNTDNKYQKERVRGRDEFW